jgi:preprotein translocase subunit YajC
MVIEIIASPVHEDTEIVNAENVQVIPGSNSGLMNVLSIITGLLIFIAAIGTFMFYLMFLRDQEKGVKSESFLSEIKIHWKLILQVSLLDWAMLFAGYLGEKEVFSYLTTTLVGFVPFFLMFYLIYKNFATQSSQGQKIFWYFSGIWAIYGIAALLPYKIKNAMYNILDIFAKNFFGIFLAYVLYKATTQKK